MKRVLPPLLLLAFTGTIFAQFPANNYRSANNPYYWKNRKPNEAYWQQDVYYKISAYVDEKTDVISGKEELTYWNNSPDELPFVFFHLYQNAFTPGSYMDDLSHHNNVYPKYGHYEKQGLGTVVSKIEVNGETLKTELDNTILKVYLAAPLKSGESVTFSIEFKTYFEANSSVRRRMKMFTAGGGAKHYDGVHWYPRMSVYDRRQGWDTDQHLEKEFYGDFGTYDVELNMANNFVLEATGVLQNKDEVMPKELREKLDIKNFATKPLYSAPSIITPYDSTIRKKYYYHAENVHDFAWTADPTYRIGEYNLDGIQIIALAQEGVASRWQNAASYTAQVMNVYNHDFGQYVYPKMVVADARDGMEYPMLTLDGGMEPDYHSLLAHEVGHNWFFGMVGNNETYRAMLDEGFTQFIDSWALTKIDGPEVIRGTPRSSYVKQFIKPLEVRNTEVYYGYMNEYIRPSETTLNTHSADFNGALRHGGGYGQVYSKTATMLYNLQYVLGDDLFLQAMHHYFDQWKICHPYVEDFRASIIQFTHVDLNWFFDEWIDTYKTIDYAVGGFHRGKEDGTYVIRFERKGKMQMPIDFIVIDKKDSVHKYHIPNTWFVKETDATVLPRWIGWGEKLQPDYEATIKIPEGIKDIVIDPTHRLADVNMLNNSKTFPFEYNFDSKIYNPPNWTAYELYSRPDLWWNGYDGFKAGIHLNGNFYNYRHIFDANVWFNSGILQQHVDSAAGINDYNSVSYRINYRTPLDKLSKNSALFLQAKSLDGLKSYTAGLEKRLQKGNNRVYAFFKSMIRYDSTDLNYLINPGEWQVNKLNNTVTIGLEHNYTYTHGTGNINLSVRSSTLASDYDYAYANLTVVNRNHLGKYFNFNTRTIVQYGTGKNWANESMLFLAGGNNEELMENKFTRSQGFFPPEWGGFGAATNHFNYAGGLGLRGYSGYLAPEPVGENIRFAYKGTAGAALNGELEFDQLFKWGMPRFFYKKRGWYRFGNAIRSTIKINTYLFGDIGVINYNSPYEDLMLADLRADAGVGAALTIKKFGPLQMVDPLTVRFDVPLFLNRVPAIEPDYVKFRWVIGVNRAF
jgi:aminopeptidase N